MDRLRKLISRNTERFVIFIGGVVASAVVSSLFDKLITWTEATLITTTVLLAIAAVYFIAENSRHAGLA